ncbi:acyl carrier protein, partial [Streptococcus agalactiae]|nr:acyl carrier protein [Streptococcus agalactiae]
MINWAEERKIIKTRQEVVDEIKGILNDSLMLDINKDMIKN